MLRCMYLPEHFRVTDHIHVCTCTLRNPHVLYTVQVPVKDSPQNCASRMWGFLFSPVEAGGD